MVEKHKLDYKYNSINGTKRLLPIVLMISNNR